MSFSKIVTCSGDRIVGNRRDIGEQLTASSHEGYGMRRLDCPSQSPRFLDDLIEYGWLLVMIIVYLMMPVVLMSGHLQFWDVIVWLPWWLVAGGALGWTIRERLRKRRRHNQIAQLMLFR